MMNIRLTLSEQHDAAAEHPAEVRRLKALFDATDKDVPRVEAVKRGPLK